jgi:hypothetical protein
VSGGQGAKMYTQCRTVANDGFYCFTAGLRRDCAASGYRIEAEMNFLIIRAGLTLR